LKTYLLIVALCAVSLLRPTVVVAQASAKPAPRSASKASPAAVVSAPNIAGEWQGALQTDAGMLRLVLKLTQGTSGQLTATLDSLDQKALGLPLERIEYADRILHFELASAARAVFEGVVSRDATEIRGNWNQGGALPLLFKRAMPTASATTTPAAKANPPAVASNPRRRVQLQPCTLPDMPKDDALCGQYEVFEDRAARKGRKIKLNLIVLPALSATPAPDPIFYLAGGPGAGATSYANAPFMLQLHRTRDVVLLDQRGTGESNPLRCEFRGDPDDMRGYFAEAITVESVRACRTELESRADLRLYTTTIAMADLDEVRDALGYDKVNVYGGSYGSTTALAYLHLYPEHVRTATLLGVAPLDFKLPLTFGRGIDHALERLFADCEADARCHVAFPELRKEFAGLVERLDKGPVTFDTLNAFTGKRQQVTMTRSGFAEHIRLMLYQPDVMSVMPLLIHEAYQQNYARFGAIAYQVFRSIDSAIARGMQFSVICAEDIPFINESELKSALGGTFYGEERARLYLKACEQWPRGDVPARFMQPIKSDTPVLMLSGELDPVTPPDVATPLLKGLTHARQVVMHNATHNSYDCAERLARDFIERGTTEGLDASCVEQIKRLPFLTTLPPLPMPK
jgi:pimeloyl-ACP methyl ester carboxylesterase